MERLFKLCSICFMLASVNGQEFTGCQLVGYVRYFGTDYALDVCGSYVEEESGIETSYMFTYESYDDANGGIRLITYDDSSDCSTTERSGPVDSDDFDEREFYCAMILRTDWGEHTDGYCGEDRGHAYGITPYIDGTCINGTDWSVKATCDFIFYNYTKSDDCTGEYDTHEWSYCTNSLVTDNNYNWTFYQMSCTDSSDATNTFKLSNFSCLLFFCFFCFLLCKD